MATETERAFICGAAVDAREPAWLAQIRGDALRAFEAEGLPDRKVEDFHYTDLKALLRKPFPPAREFAKPDHGKIEALKSRLGSYVVAIANGSIAKLEDASLPPGVDISTLSTSPDDARLAFGDVPDGRGAALRFLNAGLVRDGAIVRIRAGAKTMPIILHHTVSLTERGSVHMRHLIVLEEGATADVLEIFESEGAPSLTTSETIVHLAAGAKLTHTKLIKGSADAVHLGGSDVRLAADADYRLFVQGAGPGLAREELRTHFDGERAHVGIGSAMLLSGARHFDLTTRIDHTQPECTSDMHVRAVLAGHARGVIQGAVRVAPDAQHTDANQLIRGLLLSDHAELDSKPELEILADDVKCSHGAASGDLDAEALFYLRSRGIPESEARSVLIEAFLEEVFVSAPDGAVRDLLREEAQSWLKELAAEVAHG